MHKITVAASAAIIESQIAGFLNVSDVMNYAREVEPFIHQLAARGPYRMLIDVSGCAIQQQEVVVAFQQHVASMPRAKRLAVITGNSIVRMQIRRILVGRSMQLFTDRHEGLAWLTADRQPEAATQASLPS